MTEMRGQETLDQGDNEMIFTDFLSANRAVLCKGVTSSTHRSECIDNCRNLLQSIHIPKVYPKSVMTQKEPQLIVGIDEVGRGCLAGPVVACAVIWPDIEQHTIPLNDSKKLSDKIRRDLAKIIARSAMSWGIGISSVLEIDTINIRQASLLAMRRALRHCQVCPQQALVDGHDDPSLGVPTETIIQGDAKEPLIASASILATVYRDDLMQVYAAEYPEYHLQEHKGYGTKKHLSALAMHGVSTLHRKTFKPVARWLSSAVHK